MIAVANCKNNFVTIGEKSYPARGLIGHIELGRSTELVVILFPRDSGIIAGDDIPAIMVSGCSRYDPMDE